MSNNTMNQISYPQIVLPSYMGHLLYTPRTLNVDKSAPVVVNVDIADIFSKDFGAISVNKILKTESNLVKIMSFRGSLGPVVHTDSTTINIDTPLGRRKVNLQQYLQRAEIDHPDVLVLMADEVSIDVGHNRRRKAFQRTNSWLQESLQIIRSNQSLQSMKVFGVTMADPLDASTLSLATQSLLNHGVDGIVVGGMFMGESTEVRQVILQEVRAIINKFSLTQVNNISRSYVRMMVQGADSIDHIIDSLRAGVDLIHTNYPYQVMKKGFAFYPSFLSDHNDDVPMVGVKRPASDIGNGSEQPQPTTTTSATRSEVQADKRQKMDATGTFAPNTLVGKIETADEDEVQVNNDKETHPTSALEPDWTCLNLWDEQYMRDRRPLMEGCSCLACGKHTRAYIHHLLKSKELLAEILLYQHNQYQLQKMLDEVRKSASIEWIANKVEMFRQRHQST